MSEQKVFLPTKDTSTRTGPTQGSGANKRLYVGVHDGRDYKSFIEFDHDWSGVGKIVSAILTVYTGDNLGTQGDFTGNDPKIKVRRLSEEFTEGGSETFADGNYTNPAISSADAFSFECAPEELGVNNINVTAMIEEMAPESVKRRDGTKGGGKANHGFGFLPLADNSHRWEGVSKDCEAGLNAYKPYITLTYDLGRTTPNTPTDLAPSGAVASIGSFAADFSDQRETDTLLSSEVQVFDAGHSATIEADDNLVTDAGHGLAAGAVIYFTSLTGGTGLSTFTAYYVISSGLTSSTFRVSTTAGGSAVNITDDYTAATWSKRLYAKNQAEGALAIAADRSDHVASSFHPVKGQTYRWRVRHYDNEGIASAWTSLTSFSVTNTDPTLSTLLPASGSTKASLSGVSFEGTFADADVGDRMGAYQVQLSAYPEGDAHWDDDEFILWNTGKRYVSSDNTPTNFSTPYGGATLDTGTYYWRARVWDQHQGVSDWEYATLTMSADFVVEAGDVTDPIQMRIRAPFRIVIRDMGANRGPGDIVAVLEDAYNVGASVVWNSPGEAHWTLQATHPQLSVIEPKQTHYAIEFRQGDGWREVFAGLVFDIDASDRDIIFYGIDYLALLDSIVDEHYIPANPEKPAESGGSKYVTSGKNTIGYIIHDQLKRAREVPNSLVGFITQAQTANQLETQENMTETMTVYSTYQPALPFITGLLNSHRAGRGKRSRIFVKKKAAGGYEFVVKDDPGQTRDNLRMRFGELVQGYRVVPFGKDWATRIAGFGRDKDGVLVRYKSITGPGASLESTYGRWVRPAFFDGVSDANDLTRQVRQAAWQASALGAQMGLGLRSGILKPRDGYDVCDKFPIDIVHGSINTNNFGSGYWTAVAVTWTANQEGDFNTILTFAPPEDGVEPSGDLLTLQPISQQAEWQIGYADPNPLTATSRYWLNQSTGVVFERGAGNVLVATITGDV